jgi:squalene-hopene/tetraprenyl-beta-curcumene cyclase
MALKAFAQAGALGDAAILARARGAIDATLADPKAMEAVEKGGIGNYVMSSIASGLAAVGDADAKIGAQRAIRWLSDSQWDDAEGVDPTKDWYGGAGYGNGKRPDLSNTQMMLDAMHDAGVSPDDPAVQRALAFVARTQNRKSTNPAAWAQRGSGDGGFVYSPANGGESFASDAAGEGRYGEKLEVKSLRSYGSMTYAGFKSMLYAGLSKDDPRVKDALGWIARHFTFEENPGLGQQGYFYYLHAMSRALHAAQLKSIADANGVAHDWRAELIAALASRQREDGSWKNTAERWEESNEELATIYAVLALEEALKPSTLSE